MFIDIDLNRCKVLRKFICSHQRSLFAFVWQIKRENPKKYKFSYFLDDLSKLNSKRNILIMNFEFKQLYLEIFFVE